MYENLASIGVTLILVGSTTADSPSLIPATIMVLAGSVMVYIGVKHEKKHEN